MLILLEIIDRAQTPQIWRERNADVMFLVCPWGREKEPAPGLLQVEAGPGRKEEKWGSRRWCMCFCFSVHVKAGVKLVAICWNVLHTTPSLKKKKKKRRIREDAGVQGCLF